MKIRPHLTPPSPGTNPGGILVFAGGTRTIQRPTTQAAPLNAARTRQRRVPAGSGAEARAFTLMEVMIAIGVFCIGVFAILSLVANVMHGARLLDRPMVDATEVAGNIANTNILIETTGESGDLSEFLGNTYKGYAYVYDIVEEQSNKLFRADILVTSDAPGKPVISKMSILLYRPQSPLGTLDGGMHQ